MMRLKWEEVSGVKILHANFGDLNDIQSMSLVSEVCDVLEKSEDFSVSLLMEIRRGVVSYSNLSFTIEQSKRIQSKIFRSCFLVSDKVPPSIIEMYVVKTGSKARFFTDIDECYTYLVG